jgi:hypothetical protein
MVRLVTALTTSLLLTTVLFLIVPNFVTPSLTLAKSKSSDSKSSDNSKSDIDKSNDASSSSNSDSKPSSSNDNTTPSPVITEPVQPVTPIPPISSNSEFPGLNELNNPALPDSGSSDSGSSGGSSSSGSSSGDSSSSKHKVDCKSDDLTAKEEKKCAESNSKILGQIPLERFAVRDLNSTHWMVNFTTTQQLGGKFWYTVPKNTTTLNQALAVTTVHNGKVATIDHNSSKGIIPADSATALTSTPDTKCPTGSSLNDNGNCMPDGPCPSGFARKDFDESGKCFKK